MRPTFLRAYAAMAVYELVHKMIVLPKTRVYHCSRPWHLDDDNVRIRSSRPVLLTERVLATTVAMVSSPVIAPTHVINDLIGLEAAVRGVVLDSATDSSDRHMYVDGWASAIVL